MPVIVTMMTATADDGRIAQRPKRLRTKKSMPVPVRRFPPSLSRLEMASTADSRHLRLRDGPPKSRYRCGDLPPRRSSRLR